MKVLFTIGSLSGGGAERVVSRLASCMARKGHNVEIALIAQNDIDYPLDNNVTVKYINPKLQIKGMRYIFRCREYRKEVKHFKPDVIISFTTGVNLFVLDAIKPSSYKIILSERNDPYNDPKDEKLRKKRDKKYGEVSGIVFQTDDAKAYFSNDIQKCSTVILNPVEVPIEYINNGCKEKKIVTVGRLEHQKNHIMLINAFSEIHKHFPEYKLEIYGDGSLKTILEKYICEKELEEVVFLKGYTKNVFEAISTAKLFVLSSDYEGLSNALIEAMALGLPVVSTDHPIGGARMVIDNGVNGILTPVGDAHSFASAVCKILDDENMYTQISENAVKIGDKLDVEKITDQWIDFVNMVVNS